MNRESLVTNNLYKSISGLGLHSLKKISKGKAVTSTDFKETMSNWFGRQLPWPLVEPDLILVFEDVKKTIDDVMIVAIEIKCFAQTQDLDKRLRQCFREFGQPLRNLVFGFDSVVLWHMFSPSIAEEKIRAYTGIIEEAIQKLKLPVVYFASTTNDSGFHIYKPFEIEQQELLSTLMWLQNLCGGTRNPSMDKEIEPRRKSLKVALRVPS